MITPTTTDEARRRHLASDRLLAAAKAMIARIDDLRRRMMIDTGGLSDVLVELREAAKECE